MNKKELIEQKITIEAEKIRDEHYNRYGIRQIILDPQGIFELSAEMPSDRSSVEKYIRGAGNNKEQYAERILNVIDAFRATDASGVVKATDPPAHSDFSSILSSL